jgi:hypothetical protein
MTVVEARLTGVSAKDGFTLIQQLSCKRAG